MTTERTERAREKLRQAEAEGVAAAMNGQANGQAMPLGERSPLRLALQYFGDIRPRVDTNYVVKGFINRGEFHVVTGPSGCGKTHIATDFAIHAANAMTWHGLRTRHTAGLIVAAEGGSGINDRLEAARRQYNLPADLPLAVIADAIDLCHSDDDMRLLLMRVAEAGVHFKRDIGFVIIDTWSRAMAGGDENSPADMGALVRRCDVLKDRTGAAVVAIHHTGKDIGKGARGHSLLRAAVDVEIIVTRDEVSGVVTCLVDKVRNGPRGAKVTLALEPIELGKDGDGDPMTACYVIDAEPQEQQPASAKLSPSCSLHLAALRLAVSEGGQAVPSSRYSPDGTMGVPIDLWRRFAYERSVSGGEQNAKRMAFKRASEQLQGKGLIGTWNDWVWVVGQ